MVFLDPKWDLDQLVRCDISSHSSQLLKAGYRNDAADSMDHFCNKQFFCFHVISSHRFFGLASRLLIRQLVSSNTRLVHKQAGRVHRELKSLKKDLWQMPCTG